MLTNHIYNLLLQMTEEHKSLWRIKNHYRNDSEDCNDCKALWDKLEKDKEDHVEELEEIIRKHLG